jgi:hypothetical protein
MTYATSEQRCTIAVLFPIAHPDAPPIPAGALESLTFAAAAHLAETLAAYIAAAARSDPRLPTPAELDAAHALADPIACKIDDAAESMASESGVPFDDAVETVTNALLYTMAGERPDLFAAYHRALRVIDAAGGPR